VSAPLPDSRGPLRSLLDAWVFDKKVPAGCGFLRALGTALLVVLVAQGVTGMFLALAYVPSPDHAYEAIRAIDDDYAGGRLLRGLHHWGASAVMVLAFLHLARVYFTGAYKRPRQLLWVVGVALFGVLVGFGFTGYLLPWDMKAFWATDVGLNIVGSLPVVGGPLADLLRGGPEIGAPTLARMFALHVLFLPALLLPLAGLHLLLVHQLGITPPDARVGEPEVKSEPFFPGHVFKELLVAAVALAVVVALAWKLGPPLEAPASRDAKGYLPRPEWYFLGMFQLLKLFEGRAMIVGTAILPGLLTLLVVLLPWIDRNPERRPARRPVALAAGVLLLLGFGSLTLAGASDKGSHLPPPPRLRVGDGSYVPPPSPPIEPPIVPPDAAKGGEKAGGSAKGELAAGEALIRSYECLGCHTLAGEGNTTGGGGDSPPFEKAAAGHDADWLERYLLDPKKFKPDTDMPSAAQLEMSDADRKKIVAWLRAVAGG
jgi:ubiquinol-cytochrome c reductase cytochrome b subunit